MPDIQARNLQAAGGNSIRRFLSMSSVSQPFPGHIVKPSASSIRSSVELPMFVFLIDDAKSWLMIRKDPPTCSDGVQCVVQSLEGIC